MCSFHNSHTDPTGKMVIVFLLHRLTINVMYLLWEKMLLFEGLKVELKSKILTLAPMDLGPS